MGGPLLPEPYLNGSTFKRLRLALQRPQDASLYEIGRDLFELPPVLKASVSLHGKLFKSCHDALLAKASEIAPFADSS
jgi:hypothetical protein